MDSGFLLSLSLFPVPVIDSSAKRHFFPYFFVKKNIFVDAYLFISCLSSFLSSFVFLIRISTPLSPCLPPPSSSHPSRLVQVEFSYFFRIYFKDFKADFFPLPLPPRPCFSTICYGYFGGFSQDRPCPASFSLRIYRSPQLLFGVYFRILVPIT